MKLPRALSSYFIRHVQVGLNSLGRLYRAPLASLMTTAVIGIALALPAGLYLLTGNLQQLSNQWDGSTSLSLFLEKTLPAERIETLYRELDSWPEIEKLQLITAEQALEEFRRLSGFGEALDALEQNPLPAVIAVKPTPAHSGPETAAALLEKLRRLPEVDVAQLDLQWVKRFNALVNIVQRSISVVAALLGLAVLLIIGNTIRLEIQNRREEIEITRLVGGTDAFIRRPFLYTGLWYGLIGALLAMALLAIAYLQMEGPTRELAALYQSSFTLQLPGWREILALAGIGALLGLLGAWLAVGRHLSAIEPT